MNILGRINKNRFTGNHAETLRSLGYEVEESDDSILIQAMEFVGSGKENIYDASTKEKAKAFFGAVVEGRYLLSPGTNVLVPVMGTCSWEGGPSGRFEVRKRFRGPLCQSLQNGPLREMLGFDASALIATKVEK